MKGDFSRQTFNPQKHYSGVLMQQGRVQLDADWNEQQAIQLHRVETETLDVIGGCGAPIHQAGFAITTPEGKTAQISKGRYYVDGILCENENDVSLSAQPYPPGVPGAGAPPNTPGAPDDVPGFLGKAKATVGLVYLDVWQRHITALEDPDLREMALGGPDTTTRIQTVWQVKMLPINAQDVSNQQIACDMTLPQWTALITPSTQALTAHTATPTTTGDSDCLVPPGVGYQRLENQLYRVEVHTPGVIGTATFKWSRDNGSVATTIEQISGKDVTVHDVGPDEVLGFASGQWVEVLDVGVEVSGQPGQLLQIDSVDQATRIITLKTAPKTLDPGPQGVNAKLHPKLRRWDSAGEVQITTGGWLALESGIEVQFANATYQSGDYWLIPARTATGDIEWLRDDTANHNPLPQPPLGIVHHYCRLALAQLSGDGKSFSVQDCRKLFPPLTELPSAAASAAPPAVHITATNWSNDDALVVDQFNKEGLMITVDAPLVSQSVSSATMIVTRETGVTQQEGIAAGPATTIADFISFILNGTITIDPAQPTVIRWRPTERLAAELVNLLKQQSVLRLRVTLKGHCIWSNPQNQHLYLDGQAFGQSGMRADKRTPRTALIFPSGDAVRASDFESWFDLIQATATPVIDRPVAIEQIPQALVATQAQPASAPQGQGTRAQPLPAEPTIKPAQPGKPS